ncbi:hypothetical protein G6F24_015817 [Rhizopus arrhizus]|nr:hypothetical protein G6F24_015817 [Rhizopus arrhizus]
MRADRIEDWVTPRQRAGTRVTFQLRSRPSLSLTLLGMAGHLEGKGATVRDQTGLAQKGGAVTTHIRIARRPADIHAVRIAAGEADLVLGCDMVVVNDYWALSKVRAGRSQVVLNTYEAMPGTFTTRPDMQFPAADIVAGVRVALGGQEPLRDWCRCRSTR